MDITVTNKRIDTEPMRNLLVQGESLVDRIVFKLQKTYGTVDMTQLEYSISATNDAAEITVTEVLTKTVTATAIEVVWNIKATFTSTAGELKLMLSGADEAGEVIYQAYGEPIYVRKNPNAQGFGAIQETLYEQLLAQINYQIAHMQIIRIRGTYATLEALNAAVTDPLIGDMYNVGSAAPYVVYVWQGTWVNLGVIEGKDGDPGTPGAPGNPGTPGTDGVGVPSGGLQYAVLRKKSATDFDDEWKVLSAVDVSAISNDGVTSNIVINGGFAVNQRSKSGTVTLGAGAYGHDCWKAGESGCTYTFSTSGSVTTITITAGSLKQVIEGYNLKTGTVCLSWKGTSQGKIGAGNYAASGVTGSVTGGTNLEIEFGTGTVSLVQLNYGTSVNPFVINPYELLRCMEYAQVIACFNASDVITVNEMLTRNCRFGIPLRGTPNVVDIYSQPNLGGTLNAVDKYGTGDISLSGATITKSKYAVFGIVKTGAFVTTGIYNGSMFIAYEL